MCKCYMCGCELNGDYEEHIIPNALGGHLKSKNILCDFCGNELSHDIDNGFNEIFKNISSRLEIRIDRSKNKNNKESKKKTEGEILGIPVVIKNNKVVPSKPSYKIFGETIIFFLPTENDGYCKSIIKKINFLGREERIYDLTGVMNVNIPFKLVNSHFKKGLAKIALGFASLKKIDRSYLMECIEENFDENTNKIIFKIKDDISVIPYIPFTRFEKIFEKTKKYVDRKMSVSHFLKIFSTKFHGRRILICYIELYGCFQHYVILNNSYDGPDINDYYFQYLFESTFKEMEELPDYKMLSLFLRDLGIPEKDFYENCQSELYCDNILKKINNHNKSIYTQNLFTDFVDRNLCAISMTLQHFKNPDLLVHIPSEIIDVISSFRESSIFDDLNLILPLNIRNFYDEENNMILINYKELYIDIICGEIKNINSPLFSSIENIGDINKYGHEKFYELSSSIDKINPIIK